MLPAEEHRKFMPIAQTGSRPTQPTPSVSKTTTSNNTSSSTSSPSSSSGTSRTTLSGDDGKSSSSGRSLFQGLTDAFSGFGKKVTGGATPLEMSDKEKEAGLAASDTLSRLAGPDGTWDAKDLGRNFAQIQFPRGIKGIAARGVAAGKLLDSHGIKKDSEGYDEKRQAIMNEGARLSKENPGIGQLAKLESYDRDKLNPESQQKYDQMVKDLRSDLEPQGLLPVPLSKLQSFGDSADLLKDKLGERGLTPPEGSPVDVKDFRSLFEGKPPAATLLN